MSKERFRVVTIGENEDFGGTGFIVVDAEKHDESVGEPYGTLLAAYDEAEVRNNMVARGETQLAGRYGRLAETRADGAT